MCRRLKTLAPGAPGRSIVRAGLALAVALGTLAAVSLSAQAQADSDARSLEYPMWQTVEPGENAAYNQRESLVQRGAMVYAKYCVGCHGEYGDGNGPAAKRLITKPRDFTKGIYKFRSTDSSSLPMESDLHRTVSQGLSRVSMPGFPLMPENEKIAVIEYLKALYPQWETRRAARKVVPIPTAPLDLDDRARIERGRVVYVATQCWKCHGLDGRGEGATARWYTDAWGDPQEAFDFTRGSLKGGGTPEDIYRTFHTGLRSIMPAFGGDTLGRITQDVFAVSGKDLGEAELARLAPAAAGFPQGYAEINGLSPSELLALAEQNSWDLVAYILSLRTTMTTADAVLGAAAE